MAQTRHALVLCIVASAIALVASRDHKETHHPVFIDNPEPAKDDPGVDMPVDSYPIGYTDKMKGQKDGAAEAEELKNPKSGGGRELVFVKKYFDDNPLTPPPHDKAAKIEEEYTKPKDELKRSGRHRRHRRHRRDRRATPRRNARTNDQDDLVPAETYASNLDPCSFPYTARCGGPRYDIVNPFERRYNSVHRQLPRPPLSGYYLPVPPPDPQRWVAEVDQPFRYYPITTVYWNPGFPYDNRPFRPPRPNAVDPNAKPTGTGKPNIDDRFIGYDPDDEDRPIWDTVPTRPPSPSRRPPPPLDHTAGAAQDKRPNQVEQNEVRPKPSQQRPNNNDQQRPSGGGFGAPSAPTAPAGGGALRLGRCVYAIVSCCSASSDRVNLDCFERLGCPGPFWDRKPCSSELAVAALGAANQFAG